MANPDERNLQRRAQLMAKHRHIIDKVAKEKEVEKERELEREKEMKRERERERIATAKRAAAVREQEMERERERIAKAKRTAAKRTAAVRGQNLLNSKKRERATKKPRFSNTVPIKASNCSGKAVTAVTAMKKTVDRVDDFTSKYPMLVGAMSELYGSPLMFADLYGPELVRETKEDDDVREFLQSMK